MNWIRSLFKPSLSVRYKMEKDGVYFLETSYGFVTYRLDYKNSCVCILELYVRPESRGQGKSEELIESVRQIAEKLQINTFMTTIDPNEDTAASLRRIFMKKGFMQHKEPVKLEFELYSRRIS